MEGGWTIQCGVGVTQERRVQDVGAALAQGLHDILATIEGCEHEWCGAVARSHVRSCVASEEKERHVGMAMSQSAVERRAVGLGAKMRPET